MAVFPGTGGQVQTYALPGEADTVQAGPAFAEVVAALIRDSEQLPKRGPIQPTREFQRMFERKYLVLERVDADGSVHPQVFEGDTHAGWKVRDWLKQISER